MAQTILEVIVGDITGLKVEAVVNAANSSLLGGGGVDGAIHRAGGPAILEACKEIRRTRFPDGLPTGEAVLTTGGNLPARHVIHTVGPIYHNSAHPAEELAACYQSCVLCAQEAGITTLAFPAISTGVYGFPKPEAARVAVATLSDLLERDPGSLQRVALVAFDEKDGMILTDALRTHRAASAQAQ